MLPGGGVSAACEVEVVSKRFEPVGLGSADVGKASPTLSSAVPTDSTGFAAWAT